MAKKSIVEGMQRLYIDSKGEFEINYDVDWSDYFGTAVVALILMILLFSWIDAKKYFEKVKLYIYGHSCSMKVIKCLSFVCTVIFSLLKLKNHKLSDPFLTNRGIYYFAIGIVALLLIIFMLTNIKKIINSLSSECLEKIKEIQIILLFLSSVILTILGIDIMRQGFLSFIRLLAKNEIGDQLSSVTSIVIPIITFVLGYIFKGNKEE